jgi:hypothetical protein
VPSVRSRFVWAKLRSRFLEKRTSAGAGRLMDDRVGLRFEDGLAHGARIEQIKRDRSGSRQLDLTILESKQRSAIARPAPRAGPLLRSR